MIYGYARVSTREQNEQRQIISLTAAGVPRENIVVEKQSGKDFDRPLYLSLAQKLGHGDTLMVASIDRLGRNYDEILEQWRVLTKEHGINIVVLDMPLLDTREDKGLTGRLIADIVLQLLSYVAQRERENIKKRQAEGIAAAKARGVKFGRVAKPLPDGFAEAVARMQRGELSTAAAARRIGMPDSSFRDACRARGILPPPRPRPKRKRPAPSPPGGAEGQPPEPKATEPPKMEDAWIAWLKEHGMCIKCQRRVAERGRTLCKNCENAKEAAKNN